MSTATFQPLIVPPAPATLPLDPNILYRSGGAANKYRGANVEDLQLPPAFCLSQNQLVSKAIELAYDRDFSYIPVLDKNRRPLGYIDVTGLKTAWEAGKVNADDNVTKLATKFDRSSGRKYNVITPSTRLEDLETFLKANQFALVTDYERKFVLGVATLQDLESFVNRRGKSII